MTTSGHDPLAALRQRPFLLFAAGRFASGAGTNMLQASLAWEVYALSHSAASLGMLGAVRFGPQLILSLFAGAVADAHDRKRVILASQLTMLACVGALLAASLAGVLSLRVVYLAVLGMAIAEQFDGPARHSILPAIVAPGTYQNAITVSQSLGALASISGPALGGLAIATVGAPAAWWAFVGLESVAIATMLALRVPPIEGERGSVSVSAISEGLRFVLGSQVLFGCMLLDLFAVILGGAESLLPVYAVDILHVGGVGYGVLAASLNAGALIAALVLLWLPPVQRPGRALCFAVAAFGLATIAFGVARSLPLAVVAYAAVGMADQLSNVMRTTTENLATPDALRGRMNAVSGLFSGTSNQLGAVESGFLAAATSPTFSIVAGGIGCLIALGAVAAAMPRLRSYRIDDLATDPAGAPVAAAGSDAR